MHAPIFILFKPQMGENIGAVARAMSNFGLSDLRIVAPRDGWPNPAADSMAAGGLPIIEQATLYDTLAEALHDITQLYATSARNRALDKPVVTPREWVAILHQPPTTTHQPPKHAVLFGPERSGLSNEEIVLADGVVTIPVSEKNPSLNLGQSAVVLGYEWFARQQDEAVKAPSPVGGGLGRGPVTHDGASRAPLPASPLMGEELLATKAELNGLFEHLKPLLEDINYFREPGKTEQMWLTLRHIFTRMQPTSQEVRTLRGLIRSIKRRVR